MNYYDIVSVTGSDVKSAITLSEFLADSDKSRFEINELAKRVGALQRQGKSFDFAKFLHAGIAFQGKDGAHQASYHLDNCRDEYIERDKKNVTEISNKGFHQRLAQDTTLDFVEEVANCVVFQINKEQLKDPENPYTKMILRELKRLGITDIYSVDGCEITLRPSTRGKFPNKSSGRHRKDGSPARPSVKIHAVFSVLKGSVSSIDITEGVANEREHLHPELLQGKLVIADRGYVSDVLECELMDNGVYYIIKGKKNMASGIIVEAYDKVGNPLEDYVGKKFSSIRDSNIAEFDVTVKSSDEHLVRIVRQPNPNTKSSRSKDENSDSDESTAIVEDRYVYLRTNLPRDVIGIKKLFALYRFRWQIEFFFECLQQGNGLKSINSSNKNIIVEFILLAIISALLKLYMVIQTSRKKKVGLDSFSMIKANVKFGVFSEFFEMLGVLKKTQFYQVMKRTIDKIYKYCQKSHVSKRDREAGKSYGVLAEFLAS